MNHSASLALAGFGISTMAFILLGQARVPSRVTMCPKYFTSWAPRAHFPGCSSKWAFCSASKSHRR